MFKKLSIIALSLLTLSALAEPPDQIEVDRNTAISRAMKGELEQIEALKAAHIRHLKSKVAADEMAVRRLKTRLASTKDAAKRESIQARIDELEIEAKALTEEAKVDVQVTVGQSPTPPAPGLQAAQQPAGQPAAQAGRAALPAGEFDDVKGVWILTGSDEPGAMDKPSYLVIDHLGNIVTGARGLAITREPGGKSFKLVYDGDPTKARLQLVAPNKLAGAKEVGKTAAGDRVGGERYAWRRVSATPYLDAPFDTKGGVYLSHRYLLKAEEKLRAFIKDYPLK